MKKILITASDGYNIMCDRIDEIVNYILYGNLLYEKNKIKIPELLTRPEKSGKDAYSISAMTACKLLFRQISIDKLEHYKIGTVFSTEYGAIHTNLKYLHTLYTDGAEFVSPRQFSNTVNNSCLGTICMEYRLKGASVMLVNTFPITYAMRLIESSKAEAILTGVVDENDVDLYNDFLYNDLLKDGWYGGAAFLFLESCESVIKTGNQVIGELVSSSNVIDGFHKYQAGTIPIDKETMKRGMIMAIQKAGIQSEDLAGVFMTANGYNLLLAEEKKAILEINNNLNCIPLNSLFHTNGLVQGILDIGIALRCLEKKEFPYFDSDNKLKKAASEKQFVMINSISQDGNWATTIVKEGQGIGNYGMQ